MKWLIGMLSPLSLQNKIIIYKTVLKPVWTYGIELWGCASNSNIEIIQCYQSKILRILTDAPWYVTNHTIHSDLHIPYVREVFPRKDRYSTHCNCFTPKPPHGSTSTLTDPQTPKTTMDTRRDTLRKASMDTSLEHHQAKSAH